MKSPSIFNEQKIRQPGLYKKLSDLSRGFKERDRKLPMMSDQINAVLEKYPTLDLIHDLYIDHVHILHRFVTSLDHVSLKAIFEKLYASRFGYKSRILDLFFLQDAQNKMLLDCLLETSGKDEQLKKTLKVLKKYSNPSSYYQKEEFFPQEYNDMYESFCEIEMPEQKVEEIKAISSEMDPSLLPRSPTSFDEQPYSGQIKKAKVGR